MISAVILTKDEEKNLPQCLESIKWCDEILVIDDNSIDKTVEIAKKFGNVGSGYSHDPVTRKFLTDYVSTHHAIPPFCRSEWSTAEEALNQKFQQKLF